MKKPATGVLLLNMGGPDSLDDVAPFLYNLFSDREIIKLGPPFLQKVLARIISTRRAPKSRAIYEKIGGASPLKAISLSQAAELEKLLAAHGEYPVTIAMRYWQPFAEKAINQLVDAGVSRLVALPLYPHYSRATSGSSLNDLRKAHKKVAPHLDLIEIPSWPTQPDYIQALADKIQAGLAQFGGEAVELVYSAHSLPVSFIEDGDPYVEEINQTITAVEKITGVTGRICYQSRSGPVEWLSPATTEMIETLATEGVKNILMMPISFVSDHVETLYEVNMEFRDKAAALGMRLESTEALNTTPEFIQGLQRLVLDAVK